MSTTETTIAAPRTGRIDPKYPRGESGKGNFEMLAWLFMRVSGVILVVLLGDAVLVAATHVVSLWMRAPR